MHLAAQGKYKDDPVIVFEEGPPWMHEEYEEKDEFCPGRVGVALLLLTHGADVNARDTMGATPLHVAAGSGHTEVLEILLAHGADVNTREGYMNETPLHIAAERGCAQATAILISKGADVNGRTRRGRTPLDLAVKYGRTDVVEVLGGVAV